MTHWLSKILDEDRIGFVEEHGARRWRDPLLVEAKVMIPYYRLLTEQERDQARQQLQDGVREAIEVARRRGIALHPRIAKLKAISDFTRVCNHTGMSEKLRKDDGPGF